MDKNTIYESERGLSKFADYRYMVARGAKQLIEEEQ